MLKPLVLASLLAVPAAGALAAGPKDQLLAQVSHELPNYVADVDASQLSRHQLATIYLTMNSARSGGKKALIIRSIIDRRSTLRGLFMN